MSRSLVADPEELESTAKAEEATAWDTITRGLALSPELRVGLGVTGLLAVVATAGRVIVPILVQQILDRGFTVDADSVDLGVVTQLVAAGGAAVLLTALATGVMNLRLATVAETALSNLRRRTFAHIHDLSMLHQASEQRGVLVARVTTDIDQISRFMQWAGLQLIVNVGQATLALLVMVVLQWQLALAVVAAVPVIAVVIRLFQTRLDTAYLVVRRKVGRMLGILAETVVGAQVIRAYGVEDRTRERLDDAIADHRSSAVRAGWLSAGFSGAGELMSSMVIAGVLVVGTVLAVNDVTTVGRVVAFLFLAQLFVEPVQAFGEAVNEAQNAVAGWRRVIGILDLDPDVADPGHDGDDLPAGPLDVHFDHVDFAYPRAAGGAVGQGPQVLFDVDVRIAPRSKVAVVGETGSGKTTFAKLLTRLMDPTGGTIRLAGVPLQEVRFPSLRDRVVMVPQDGMLFSGSILDNVLMGDADGDPDDVRRAFAELQLDEWIEGLPQGLQTAVGERGDALSAGERQLVALARAYLADPDLLVLDEATSAVDPAAEMRLQRALAGLTEGRTTVTIAHRLSTAEQADRVLVFDRGRIVEDGPHGELVAAGGLYAGLHRAWQAGTTSGG
ncbi:ABC transporter ATP-binding protein [Euzebya tangerina]|uniref:ABC transporter ATP-binding protein n=1 Tax=Euzebya tangerina TaxID=591198 RepID=UPI000E30FC89|nr:ABC transporter ATP-binding protein [Euzebya tangerina]